METLNLHILNGPNTHIHQRLHHIQLYSNSRFIKTIFQSKNWIKLATQIEQNPFRWKTTQNTRTNEKLGVKNGNERLKPLINSFKTK